MPRGGGAADPKPIEPWRGMVLRSIENGYKSFTSGPYRTHEEALEAKRGFFRATIGGANSEQKRSLRNAGYDVSIQVSIVRASAPGFWIVRVTTKTRAEALAWSRKAPWTNPRYGRAAAR